MLKKSKDTNTWKLEKTTSLCKIQDQSGKIIGVAHFYKSPVKSSFARMDSLNPDSSKHDMPVEKNNDKDGQVIHAAELDTSKSINDSKMLQEISETIIPVENTCGSICKVSYCQNFAANQRLVDFLTNFELNKFSGDMSHGNAKELSNVHDCSDYLNATSLEESKKYSKCNLSKSSVDGKFDTITRTISNSTHKIPIDEQALVINNNMSHSPGLRHTHSDIRGVLSHGTFEPPQNKLSNNSFVVSPSFQSNDNHAIRLGWCSRTCTESTFQPLYRSASSRDVDVDSDLKININDGTSSGTCNDAIAPHDLFFVRSVNNDTSSGKIVASNAKSSTKTHRFSVEEFGKPCGMSKVDVPRDQAIDRKSIHEWFYQSSADLHSKYHEGSCPEGFLKSKPRVDNQPIGDYGFQFKGKVNSERNEQQRNKMIDEENISKNTERWFPEETKEGSRNIETFESLDAINNLGGYPASSFPNESESVLESALVPEVSHDRNSGLTSPGTKECCDTSSSTLEDYVSLDRNLQCLQLASESSFNSISPEIDDHVQKHVCRESVSFDAKVTPESFKVSKTNRNELNCPLGILRDRYQDIQGYHSTVFESEKNFEPSEHITWPETPALLHLTNHSDYVSFVNSTTQSKSPHVPIHTWKSSETELRDIGIGLPVPGETFKMQTELMLDWFKQFNDEQRNILLKKILSCCDMPQMHLLSVMMENNLHKSCPPNCQDMLVWLPHTVTLKILMYLDPVSLCRCNQVNRAWKELSDNPLLWQRLTRNPDHRLSEASSKRQFQKFTLPTGDIHWKKVFAERYLLQKNWLNGTYTLRTFEGHHQGIACVQFDDTRIVSGSSDKTIKADEGKLVSGSYDKTVKVWDLKTGECRLTMRGHTAAVLCVQFDEQKIVSGSYDKKIKVWDLHEGTCLMTLDGHQDAVTCLNLTHDGMKIITGSLDYSLKFWDLCTGKCYGTLDWITSEGHTAVVRCLQVDSWRIVSGGDDKTLKVWELATGQRLLTLRYHSDGVTCMQFNDFAIVSGSYDRTVKLWDFTPKHPYLETLY
ncbi:uncharacterized protein LOC124434340 isoform X2 [Xenia sp. Carnegie-2017]|uniref:uncharacterized protein LOC124434340 isoform X2 n=1 Tax=Xenia sp. Carnegie-2017 TaxID=2897299 RepID=UPI001F04D63D|nr:uncharacterized protein LOC124434340 isoform X2 [Xenia sp. Carnegie-2017]